MVSLRSLCTGAIRRPSTKPNFHQVKAKVQEVANDEIDGVYTLRINLGDLEHGYTPQLCLYNTVGDEALPDSNSEGMVTEYWHYGGRTNTAKDKGIVVGVLVRLWSST